jgi:hypothetical protein
MKMKQGREKHFERWTLRDQAQSQIVFGLRRQLMLLSLTPSPREAPLLVGFLVGMLFLLISLLVASIVVSSYGCILRVLSLGLVSSAPAIAS